MSNVLMLHGPIQLAQVGPTEAIQQLSQIPT